MKLFLVLIFGSWGFVTAAAVVHILLNKRDPRGGALWITMSILLPFAGPAAYWILGINRLKRRSAFRSKMRMNREDPKPSSFSHTILPPSTSEGVTSLAVISERVTRQPLTAGNSIEPLYEGNKAFPAMLTAIGSARHSINLSTYILDKDAVGRRIISALCTSARNGVQVRVLVDGIGTSRAAISMARTLRGAGAKLAVFHPLLGLPMRRPSINLRNHRKLLIIDGKEGFTGGLNITSRHFLSRVKKTPLVRDIHFRVEGPVVSSMQEVFAQDWQASRNEVLEGEPFFPEPLQPGSDLIRAVPSGPDEDFENIYEIILGALRSARSDVLIMTPYFIPDRTIIHALRSAVLAGVAVDLVLPEKSDHPLVQKASMAYLSELIQTGVRTTLVWPPFVHSKLLVVDGFWSLIGSANLDSRSFRLNFEFDLEVYSRPIAEELTKYIRGMSAEGTVLESGMLSSRPLPTRLFEGAVKIFSPYL
jgi:cardiolipin synthase